MGWLTLIFQSKIARQIGAALLLIMAVLTFGKVQRRKGATGEAAKQERVDREEANNVRERVDGVKPVRDDDLKYRD